MELNTQLALGIRIPANRSNTAPAIPAGRPRRLPVVFRPVDWDSVIKRLREATPEDACHEFLVEPVVIKVSLKNEDICKLDNFRLKTTPIMTQPDSIRLAVELFLESGYRPETVAVRLRFMSDNRKKYIRVPFDGQTAERIGEPVVADKDGNVTFEGTGICYSLLCTTRQQAIEIAVKWFLEKIR